MTRTRNPAFDVAKVIATILILFHHYQQVTTMVTGHSVYSSDFDYGYMVELFFLISGFFMFSYVKKIQNGLTFYHFFTRRIARLVPLMAVSGVLCAVALSEYSKIYQQSFWGIEPSLFGVLVQALGIHEGWGFENPYLNSPTWYCSVLLLCYLVFYAIVYWSQRLKVSPLYGFAFMMFLGCGAKPTEEQLLFLTAYSRRGFYAFFAGVLFAFVLPCIQKWRAGTYWGLAFLAVFGIAFYKKEGDLQYMAFLLTFLVYPVCLVLLQRFPFSLIGKLPFWEGWSKISYSVFIWHFPLYVLLYDIVKIVGIDPQIFVSQKMMLLCAVVMQLVGWLSYHFVEQPLYRKTTAFFAAIDPSATAEHN